MGVEAGAVAWVYKLLWVPFIGPVLVWLVKRVVTDIYTKQEVIDKLNDRLAPLELVVSSINKSLDANTKAVDKLTNLLADLDKRLTIEEYKGQDRRNR